MASGWNAYIKNLFDGAPSIIRKAAIVGINDSSVWAKSEPPVGENFNASHNELQTITRYFQNGNYKDVPTCGIVLEGMKYIVPLVDEATGLIFGKKDKTGVFLVKTNMAVLIALFTGDNTEGLVCRKAVENLALYLQQQGY